MAAFIILIIIAFPGVIVCWFRHTDRQAIETDSEQYYDENGNHIYYDRKLIAHLKKEKQKTIQ